MRYVNLNIAICIPARMGSTRFPDKPIALLHGQPMIRRVYERCCMTGLDTFVLTDSKRVASLFPEGNCVVQSTPFDNGTERCAGFPFLNQYDAIINVQGDMPDITTDIIKTVANGVAIQDPTSQITTVYTKMNKDLQKDPNSVKLIHTGNRWHEHGNRVHWFCRAGLEYGSHHLGVYGYTRKALSEYIDLTQFKEETIEKLEQLRWLQNGYNMSAFEVEFNGMEINTPEELKEWHLRNSQ